MIPGDGPRTTPTISRSVPGPARSRTGRQPEHEAGRRVIGQIARVVVMFTLSLLFLRASATAADVLLEAEAFAERGGWVVDSQFISQMGSSYLLAHGLGRPVANARTQVDLPGPGTYHVWVRTKDWVPSHHPGRFQVLVDGKPLAPTFGATGEGWIWQDGGPVEIRGRRVTIELKDLTGFDGRCDALLFTTDRALCAGLPTTRAVRGSPDPAHRASTGGLPGPRDRTHVPAPAGSGDYCCQHLRNTQVFVEKRVIRAIVGWQDIGNPSLLAAVIAGIRVFPRFSS